MTPTHSAKVPQSFVGRGRQGGGSQNGQLITLVLEYQSSKVPS